MSDFTSTYEPDAGQVILERAAAGVGGEAGFAPAPGTDLAFDRVNGHLIRVVADLRDESAAMPLLTRLLGPEAIRTLRDLKASPRPASGPGPQAPEPALEAALSGLARLAAIRDTSPVPRHSPWWGVEAAVLARQAGLAGPPRPDAASLRDALGTREPKPGSAPSLDVAAELEGLEKASVRLPGVHWMMDPGLVAPGLFRPGLSPYSDLLVRRGDGANHVTVTATLASGASEADAGRCVLRLVEPAGRSVLAQAPVSVTGTQAGAELQLPDDRGEAWIEVVEDPGRPVRGTASYLIRQALRWADAALRAERAPHGLDPEATADDWAALAAAAWERCCRDWHLAGYGERAAPRAAPGARIPSPLGLAEVLGGGGPGR